MKYENKIPNTAKVEVLKILLPCILEVTTVISHAATRVSSPPRLHLFTHQYIIPLSPHSFTTQIPHFSHFTQINSFNFLSSFRR
ncbi:hypothetical protein L1987_05557 [Smallanthus sonchifolius]|uniref:Uncharacterized protein n=1 Tax=Smallanthus sonchifolius TaxID=185202 RepID=A0ACB9JVU1_9ASTR|nr:hypothetical protein L1987_05557 [Smallanthus sonchifolius]